VGANKDRARRLEREARGDLASFQLQDDSTYYYAPSGEVYLHCYACIGKSPHDWPEVPELLAKVLEAKNVAAALEQIMSPAVSDIFPFDRDVLVAERRLVPRSIVAGRDLEEEVPDLSE
jgi:hypothetical protein